MKLYKHLFFDLDNTLWDFRANAHEAFREIFTELQLDARIPDFGQFLEVYEHHNEQMWLAYRQGRIKKDQMRVQRMAQTFKDMGVDDPGLAQKAQEIYRLRAPQKSNLFPEVLETLDYLKARYNLYILTNGFLEVQVQKIANSGLDGYFNKMFMAEMVGYQKPDRRFFEYAVKSIHAHKSDVLMIGDDPEADIRGAAHSGLDQVFFNPGNLPCPLIPTWQIRSFGELRSIL